MKFTEAMKIMQRMCAHNAKHNQCDDCAMNQRPELCSDYMINHPEEALEILEKWKKEHPAKTHREAIQERYPGKPWQKHVNQENCSRKICLCTTPCLGCDWWDEEEE